MKILVTGSSGTIGTRLCETLLAAKHDVIGVDRVPNKWQPSVQRITKMIDLLVPEQADSMPSDVDVVIHLAANARVYDLVKDPTRARDNFLTLFNTLEHCRRKKIPRIIFASSRECYGNVQLDRYTEDKVRVENCESPYTASKLGGEALMTSYDKCYGIGTVILRFSNVYGAYDDSDRVVPLFIRRARAGEDLTVFGEGKSLDFTYIDDTVAGVIRVVEQFDAIRGETINIASGKAVSLVDCAKAILTLTKSASKVSLAPPRTGEVTHYVADITKARTKLGYDPKVPFEEGIQKAVDWYSRNKA